MAIINANGGAHNAICANCGASLTYPVWVETRRRSTGELVKSEAYGTDCFEIVFGMRYENLPTQYRKNNHFDPEQFKADKIAAAESAAAQKVATETKNAEIAVKNAWLIKDLVDFGLARFEKDYVGKPFAANFFASIVMSLQNGELATELTPKAKSIITDALAKLAGRSGSKKYNARYDEIAEKLGGV